MRYRFSPSSPWVYCQYITSNMCRVLVNGLEYGIEGRDYFRSPTHWGVTA